MYIVHTTVYTEGTVFMKSAEVNPIDEHRGERLLKEKEQEIKQFWD